MRHPSQGVVTSLFLACSVILSILIFLAGCLTSGGARKTASPILAVSSVTLDFSTTEKKLPLTITNTGDGELTWKILPGDLPAWCSFEPVSGYAPAEVVVVVDRTNIDPGNYKTVLTIQSNGGTKTVTVLMAVPERGGIGTIIIDTPIPK